jgi:hypothetical protein
MPSVRYEPYRRDSIPLPYGNPWLHPAPAQSVPQTPVLRPSPFSASQDRLSRSYVSSAGCSPAAEPARLDSDCAAWPLPPLLSITPAVIVPVTSADSGTLQNAVSTAPDHSVRPPLLASRLRLPPKTNPIRKPHGQSCTLAENSRS